MKTLGSSAYRVSRLPQSSRIQRNCRCYRHRFAVAVGVDNGLHRGFKSGLACMAVASVEMRHWNIPGYGTTLSNFISLSGNSITGNRADLPSGGSAHITSRSGRGSCRHVCGPTYCD